MSRRRAPFLVVALAALPGSSPAQTTPLPAFEVAPLPELAGATSRAGAGGFAFVDIPGGVTGAVAAGSSADSAGVLRAVVCVVPPGEPPEPVVPLSPLAPSQDSWANGVVHDPTNGSLIAYGAATTATGSVLPVVWTLAAAGSHSVPRTGTDGTGRAVPPGMYLLTLSTEETSRAAEVVRLR